MKLTAAARQLGVTLSTAALLSRTGQPGDFAFAYHSAVPPWDFTHLGDVIATYSCGPTLAGVPAGGRAEGGEFEAAVRDAWTTCAREVRRTVGAIWVVNRDVVVSGREPLTAAGNAVRPATVEYFSIV